MKLTKTQEKALNLCIKMSNNYTKITQKEFALSWRPKRKSTLDAKVNAAREMLDRLAIKGYLEKIEIGYREKHYIVTNRSSGREYVPI